MLKGKYILLKKEQYYTIIPILLNLGYHFPNDYIKENYKDDFEYIKHIHDSYERCTITLDDDNNYTVDNDEKTINGYANWDVKSQVLCKGKSELNVYKILRETKLKRILK